MEEAAREERRVGEPPEIVRPGVFGTAVAADARRSVFDWHNEALLGVGAPSVDVVFIGDSITEMWCLDAFFRPRDGVLVNRGIGGDSTPYLRRRFEADALQLRPSSIVLLCGVNNTWDLDVWWDDAVERDPRTIENAIVADCAAMTAAARGRDVDLALCSILPTHGPHHASVQARNGLIMAVNARLRLVARDHGAAYVDYHSALVAPDGLTLRRDLAVDGVHPHRAGYHLMAATLLETAREAGWEGLRGRSP